MKQPFREKERRIKKTKYFYDKEAAGTVAEGLATEAKGAG
jgi:hypothetical protein